MTDLKHLRQIASTYYGTAYAGAISVCGPVVPAGKRMYVSYIKVSHDHTDGLGITLCRNGSTFTVEMDAFLIPGSGLTGFEDMGESNVELYEDIESPIYILESGEQIGLRNPDLVAGVNIYVVITGYMEP